MRKKTYNIILVVGYIGFMVGMAFAKIGQSYEGGAYPWHLPIQMFWVLMLPFLGGYCIGKESEAKK